MKINKFLLASFISFAMSLNAFAISVCEEDDEKSPPNKVGKFHFNWVGGAVPRGGTPNYENNIIRLCADINSNKINGEKYEINLWGNNNNFQTIIDSVRAHCAGIDIVAQNTET